MDIKKGELRPYGKNENRRLPEVYAELLYKSYEKSQLKK
jgi:hypothetical protein